ncbi:hypothetical protein PR048_001741, partial [Dryococelus australis]
MILVAENTVNPDVKVSMGERLRLRCSSAQPAPNVVWYKDDHLLRNKADHHIRVSKELLKLRVAEGDTGRYACLLMLGNGSRWWHNISLSVLPPDRHLSQVNVGSNTIAEEEEDALQHMH